MNGNDWIPATLVLLQVVSATFEVGVGSSRCVRFVRGCKRRRRRRRSFCSRLSIRLPRELDGLADYELRWSHFDLHFLFELQVEIPAARRSHFAVYVHYHVELYGKPQADDLPSLLREVLLSDGAIFSRSFTEIGIADPTNVVGRLPARGALEVL